VIKCEHCGTEPVQNCADCRYPGNILEQTMSADYCPWYRNTRPMGCPACTKGKDDATHVRVIPEAKAIKAGSPYISGCVARATDQAFLSNPIPRDEKLRREQWFNGWLDTNDRLTGVTVPVDVQCPCQYVTVTDLRIIQLLRS
jgi:hypothetical protein